jgi:hypothetical protein
MPTEFKKGKWNPSIELTDVDRIRESKSNDLIFECCIRCNNKNVIRAALTENKTLMKKCLEAKNKISAMDAYWSPEIKLTAIEYIAIQNCDELLEVTVHPNVHVPAHSTYEVESNLYFN